MAVLLCLLAVSGRAAERTRVPGTAVSIVPPPGFSPADRFPGFQLPDRAASIMVTEIPGPAAAVRKGMTAEGLATRGMSLIESRTLTIDGNPALLLFASQVAQDVEFYKWMLVTGDSKRCVMVVGAYPATEEDLSGPVRASVTSVSWKGGETKGADLFEGLPFRVTLTPALKVAGRVSNMLVFTESGNMVPAGGDQAVFAIGSSLGEVAVSDVEAFSKERAEQSPHIVGQHDLRGSALTVGGLDAYEIVALGEDAQSREPVLLYQLVLVDERSYYIAQGFTRPDRVPDFVPEFRRLATSFQLVPPGPAAGR